MGLQTETETWNAKSNADHFVKRDVESGIPSLAKKAFFLGKLAGIPSFSASVYQSFNFEGRSSKHLKTI